MEPVLAKAHSASAATHSVDRYESDRCASHGSDRILELFDWLPGAAHGIPHRERGEASAEAAHDDIMVTLGNQYYQALESTDISFGDWIDGGPPSGSLQAEAPPGDRDLSDDTWSPITGLLSDVERLEDAFGPLRDAEVNAPFDRDSIPEILRLFAPPEFLASSAKRVNAMLPSIARRDHHTLAIDSPLVALNGEARTDTAESAK